MTPRTKPLTLQSIQVLRGLAAVGVIAFHCGTILAQTGGEVLFAGVTAFGKLGVNLFFLLSGFIILKAHAADIGHPSNLPRYAFRRLARIYPIYWIVLTVNIAVSSTGLGDPDFSWAPENLASAYALLPLTPELSLPLKVAWSLFYEIRFYLLFAIALLSGRLALVLATVWLAAILGAAVLGLTDPLELLSPWNLYFLAGMGICWLSERMAARHAPLLLVGGIAVILAFVGFGSLDSINTDGVTATTFWFLPAFSLLLLGAVLLEPKMGQAPPVLLFLGDASYSIYLVHTSAISVLALLANRLGLIETAGGYGFFVFALVFAVSAGSAVYLLVERPLLAALSPLTPRRAVSPVGQETGKA